MIEIKSIAGRVLFAAEVDTVAEALERAAADGANLACAYLARAYLARANLACAKLAGARLAGANLEGADLDGAYLACANLEGANLEGATLARAKLAGANLEYALKGPSGIDHLAMAREDICAVLDAAPAEVPALLATLREGRIDGTVYEGECACLVGTIANVRGVRHDAIPGLAPDSTRPAERWFLHIRKGDTPLTSTRAAYAAAVIEDWMRRRRGAAS